MPETRSPLLTGGCQCGAVRYAVYAEPTGASVCHCRMCQKAFGNYFAPLAGVRPADFAWTRGAPGIFRSSEIVERGFCRDCGTPLSFRYTIKDRISFSLGSLDDPARVPPAEQFGIESRYEFVRGLCDLPGDKTTEEETPPEMLARMKSWQHPDHERGQ
jgi:hypothetical protein